MTLKDIKNVLTFAAFRPEADDGAATWARRFPNKRTLLLNVGKTRTSWRSLGKGGKLHEGGIQKGDFKDIITNLAPEWRKLTDDGWCNVSVNSRYVISLEGNLPRKEGSEDTGVIRGGGTTKVLLESLILKSGQQLPALIEGQTETLVVRTITDQRLEIAFVETDERTEPRKILIPINLRPQVAIRRPEFSSVSTSTGTMRSSPVPRETEALPEPP